jgi:hypothetical protein
MRVCSNPGAMEASALAAALFAIGAGVLAPGAALVRALGLGRDGLERIVIAVAAGRVLLAAATLACAAGPGPVALRAWPFLGVATFAFVAWRKRRGRAPRAPGAPARLDRGLLAACAVAVGAALLLVHAVVARSGVVGADGALDFRGRDTTDDPIVYASLARGLLEAGLPFTHPFAAGAPATGQYVHLAALAGLHGAGGVPMLDAVFRVAPALDAASLALTLVALARAFGGGALAAGLAGALPALAGGASFLLAPLAWLLGRTLQPLDSWEFFGPYFLAFNPIAPALQALAAAFLLLLAPGALGRRGPALVAGGLVASLFETKLFLWAPALAGLAGVAWLRPPRGAARALRIAAWIAIAGSIPSLAEKAFIAGRYSGTGGVGFGVCAGCLPLYLVNASLGNLDTSFALFKSFRAAHLLEPRVALFLVLASALTFTIALGARFASLPELTRVWREPVQGDPAASAVLRWIALGSALSILLAFLVVTTPHSLNGAQFAWFASFLLWPLAALHVERWLAARRVVALGGFAALALPSLAFFPGPLAYGAPVRLRVSPEERALCEKLAAISAPGDAVLEPSILKDVDRPSPIPLLAGRPVHLSLVSVIQSLPKAERDRRFEEVLALFAGDDAETARRAVAASGARFVVVPAGWRLNVDPAWLEPVLHEPAGVVYRVPESIPR